MPNFRTLLFTAAVLGVFQTQVHAMEANYAVPLNLAAEAATEALRVCEASGYHVAVAVLDLAGQANVQLKGDNSTPHTTETAFRKAYSVVTLGRNYGLDSSAQVGAAFYKNPALYSAILTLPSMGLLPGAVAIKVRGSFVGAIGVSGAPGGEKDEACAVAGIAKISDRLPK